ncbi:MAG: dUTPase [Candidatus Jacksonbacteria bacterium RIFOXYA2_FULL_44_7]|uniref:dUTP diphosphatase n=1 Tax=Candidatus Jacksonbacteria bacterium RIFCSPLOWO2_02_FULL_44_20 TaxID=1798460 RepID=A0A1G2ABQ8_9BACT|nr:MAG: Deoxyuridine 5'-triphosphate nucleotidohydrolase Dut [Parcubacteria group bacterium GW2011_GWC2_44_17]KKT48828.1 MAG: Deoxyuridine 5'-triphosphate nucleotidohydrolase Dut [Parcubacteria group bacterium GW2011_GWF2_44_17]OGY70421.1 MAG: dUTPase [Candidatus Jacksonbacteria bacterium RIFCSPHIGHO2_12_FULL_44_12]OGY71163.1 MAG: dUTPase [Candidatus Jacksonbacteria bacterium RIFCSPHIGHO2_02_FULL_44_25]OGY73936.1 MAG: dUTPase [Candidatus Jacksonbacteria bacterium RIFCSPLOWO2_02_FULL_44_20]OGY7
MNERTRVKIIRIDKTLPIPEYQTKGAVAFDLYAREDAVVAPKEIARIAGNVIIETPPGYMFMVVPRSSTPRKYGLSIPQGIGIIDQDFCGPEDELILQLYNFTDKPVTIERGTRLAQAVLVKIALAEFEEVNEIAPNSRGGFGSTG